jgi:hypothetical protein
VLLLSGGHQKVIDVVGDWHEAAIEQQPLGGCVESSQGHVISLSLHGSHLSGNLRTFRARLIVPATNRCMVNLQIVMLGAPTSLASIMVVGPHHAPAVMHVGDSSEVGQREHMVRQWASRVSGEIISSYRKPQRGYR